jgi:hypothetical protein
LTALCICWDRQRATLPEANWREGNDAGSKFQGTSQLL